VRRAGREAGYELLVLLQRRLLTLVRRDEPLPPNLALAQVEVVVA